MLAKRVKLTKLVFAIDSVTSNSEVCNDALEHIQQFNDKQWDEFESAIDNLEKSVPASINLTSIVGDDPVEILDGNLNSKFHTLADRAFLHSLQEPQFEAAESSERH